MWTVVGILILFITSALLLKLPSVQTYLARKATVYLSKELNAKIDVKRIGIRLFSEIDMQGIYLEDQYGDTLLYTDHLLLTSENLDIKNRSIDISAIQLTDPIIQLRKKDSIPGMNLDFLIDFLKGNSSDSLSTEGIKFKTAFHEIELINARFSFHHEKFEEKDHEIDFRHLDFYELNGLFYKLSFASDSILFDIKRLAFKEKGGLQVNDLQALTIISSTGMSFETLHLSTAHSDIVGNYRMRYDNYDDFDFFQDRIRMDIDLSKCDLASKDLAEFSSALIGFDKVFKLQGKIKGTVSSFKGKDLKLTYDDNTYFEGDINLVGLPDVKETFIDLHVNKLLTHSNQINRIPVAPFDSKKYVIMPEQLKKFGNIFFSGNFTGFYNDFVAYGNFNTDMGKATSDLNLKINADPAKSSYSGRFVTNNFDLGKLLSNKILGNVTFDLEMAGKGFSLASATSTASGTIREIELYGYNYKNIEVDGNLGTEMFTGEIKIENEDLDLDFSGTIDLTNKIPVLDFRTRINHAYLSRLNLVKRDSLPVLSTIAELQVTGNKIDNVFGTMSFYSTRYSEGQKEINIDTLKIKVSEFNNIRFLNISSELVDAEVRGIFQMSKAGLAMGQMLSRYFPVIDFSGDTVREKQSFDYEINLKKSNLITEIFIPDLRIAANSYLFGKCDNWTDDLTFILRSNRVDYKKFTVQDVSVNSKNIQQDLLINAGLGKLAYNDSTMLNDITVDCKTNRIEGVFGVRYTESDTASSFMHIKTGVRFATADEPATFKLLPSRMVLNGERWLVNPENLFSYRKNDMHFENMTFKSATQSVKFDGYISDKVKHPLQVSLVNYDLSLLNTYFAVINLRMGGIINGSIDVRDLYETPNFNTNLKVKDFVLFSDTLGDADIQSSWNAKTNTIDVNAFVDRGSSKNVQIDGYYQIVKAGPDVMDFDIEVDKMYLQTLGQYVKVVASDVKGLVSGKLNVAGNFVHPKLTGKLNIQKAGFLVDYLNTRYSFSHEVEFKENYVEFNNLVLNDMKGNQAVASGRIVHNQFKNLVFDVSITANGINCLNTNALQNDLFYGTAYGTGNVSIKGTPEYLNLIIGMKSEGNTKIYIPLYYPEEVGSSSFVTFINTGVKHKISKQDAYKIKGLNMIFDFEVTSDAEMQLIFDPKIGDLIKGNGSGNIRMEIDPTGKFDIFGDYTIEYGDYLFTLQNVINKKFLLKPGGVIRWSGDPYKADVDISAIYKLRASLYDLIRDTTGSYKRRIPVEVHLNLQEDLFNPKIDFDIVVPDIDPTVQTQVNRYLNTEQEKSEQAFSLLVLNRFATPQELQSKPNFDAGSSVSANASELLSNQLSQWASQISNNFDLGLNYRSGTSISKEELEVALSTTLFNERVIIDGNFGVSDNDNTSNLVGDFKVEVKASDDGKIRLKAYNKANNSTLVTNLNSQYTQGIGVFYREEFNSVGDLFRRFKYKKQGKKGEKSDLSKIDVN